MTAAMTVADGRVARRGTLPLAAMPGAAAVTVDVVRVVVAIVIVAVALAGIALTCDFLAGPIPAAGPQPGF